MKFPPDHLIIFDGYCNLCNGFVNFIMKYDRKKIFYFIGNQSDVVKNIIPVSNDTDNSQVLTIYYLEKGVLFHKSEAVLRILSLLPFPLRLLSVFRIVPKFISDPIYNFVAKNRYKWFGKRDQCRLPTKEEASRFL